jgi:hypothetical protein
LPAGDGGTHAACPPAANMARGPARPLLGLLLGQCIWLAPTCAQVTQCTDLDVGGAQLSRHRAFGGIGFCCTEHTPGDPASVLCCPGDGNTTYLDNKFCHEGTVELQPSATPGTQENFLRENVCPACLLDGTCSPGTLQLDNVQTQGPKVRSE